jgi:serine/threonine protein kinase/tetratricopeptide (TPR) repeat protein
MALSDAEGALTPEKWTQLEILFHEGLALPEEKRRAFFDAACAGDSALRGEIEALLHADHAEGPLDRLAAGLGAAADAAHEGQRIGPYTIVREIERGGMGIVFLARRTDGQYDRDVALKVIQNPFEDERQRDRFLGERQIVARLSHPGIAKLFDGGVTTQGLPYFTMEYVDGVPIDAYCDERRLDIAARVRLFTQVCGAVAAAHRGLIVHRDLKPGNVLVTPDGEVKLIDFGIAKALDATSDATCTGGILFTPDYASPEQVRGEPVTTASDVYSLGALLYQVLTGAKPHRFTSRTPSDIERTICEHEPPRPSAVIAALGRETDEAERDRIANARRTRPDRLVRRLKGDLDTIVMKTLHKDPSRRYASVDLLLQDLENHLSGHPVLARPDSVLYSAWKFTARHRVTVLAAAVMVISLTVGLAAAMIQARRADAERAVAAAERDRARAEAARVTSVSRLLTGIFSLANPSQGRGDTITARDLLDRGAKRIDTELAGDPATQADLFAAVGQVYFNLALFEDAEKVQQRALGLREAAHGSASREVADSLHDLASVQLVRGRYDVAEAGFRKALALRQQLQADPSATAATLQGLGEALSEVDRHADAEPILREALALRRKVSAPPQDMIATLNALALTLHRKGGYAEAEDLFRDAADRGRSASAPITPARVSSVLNLALIVHRFDRNAVEAEPLYKEALALARTLYPNDHPDVATCLSEYARGMREQGRVQEAEAMTRDALAMWQRLYGPKHREVMISTQTLAGIIAQRGRAPEAERLYREALAMGLSLFGESHLLVLGARSAYAAFLEGRGRLDEARAEREAELAAATRQFGESHAVVARAVAALGRHALDRGEVKAAEELFRRALAVRERVHPATHWRVAEARIDLGRCLLTARRYAEAEPVLVAGYQALQAARDAPSEMTATARTSLAALYEGWGRPEQAVAYRATSR